MLWAAGIPARLPLASFRTVTSSPTLLPFDRFGDPVPPKEPPSAFRFERLPQGALPVSPSLTRFITAFLLSPELEQGLCHLRLENTPSFDSVGVGEEPANLAGIY